MNCKNSSDLSSACMACGANCVSKCGNYTCTNSCALATCGSGCSTYGTSGCGTYDACTVGCQKECADVACNNACKGLATKIKPLP